jgi:hypothetical protein
MLLGDESALDSFDGNTEGAFKMGHVRDGEGTERAPKQAEAPSYAGNQSAPDVETTQGQIDHYTKKQQDIETAWGQLQEMQADMPQEQFEQAKLFLQGQAAGSMIALQNAQIQQMNEQSWLETQKAQVMQKHADIFGDDQKRAVYGRKMIDYLGSIGYSGAELQNIGAREYNAVLDHIKVTEERDRLKMENAVYKREAKQRAANINRGRRDSEVGAKGTKGVEAQQDEIMKVLFGGGR